MDVALPVFTSGFYILRIDTDSDISVSKIILVLLCFQTNRFSYCPVLVMKILFVIVLMSFSTNHSCYYLLLVGFDFLDDTIQIRSIKSN